jgi:hypothetical protein
MSAGFDHGWRLASKRLSLMANIELSFHGWLFSAAGGP